MELHGNGSRLVSADVSPQGMLSSKPDIAMVPNGAQNGVHTRRVTGISVLTLTDTT